jgi:hypothetical protein
MADSYYTSLGGTGVTNAIMLESQPTGANVPHTAEIVAPDADGLFLIKDGDPKGTVKNARMVAYQTLNSALLGPYATRALALAAQNESS